MNIPISLLIIFYLSSSHALVSDNSYKRRKTSWDHDVDMKYYKKYRVDVYQYSELFLCAANVYIYMSSVYYIGESITSEMKMHQG